MIDAGMLDGVPLLRGLNKAAKREIATRSVLRRFAASELLWRAGTESRGLLCLKGGCESCGHPRADST